MTKRLWLGLALLWTLAIFIGCALPGASVREFLLFSQDKLIHLLAFAGFGLLWYAVYPQAFLRILLWGTLYGLALEVYQQVMPIGRFFDPLDALADTVGLLLGLGMARLLPRRWWLAPDGPTARST